MRAKALWVAGYLRSARPTSRLRYRCCNEAWSWRRRLETASRPPATQYLGLCRLFVGDLVGAVELLEGGGRATPNQPSSEPAAFALSDVAVIWMLEGEIGRAISVYEEALAMTDEGGEIHGRVHTASGASG